MLYSYVLKVLQLSSSKMPLSINLSVSNSEALGFGMIDIFILNSDFYMSVSDLTEKW